MIQKIMVIILVFLPIIAVLFQFLCFMFKNYIKYRHVNKIIKNEIKRHKLRYYREIPSKNTAAGVAFLIEPLNRLNYADVFNVIYRIIQATILELSINGTIEISEDENKEVILEFTNNNEEKLKNSQIQILKLLKKYKDNNGRLRINDFKRHIKLDIENYKNTFNNDFAKMIIDEQSETGNCSSDMKEYNKMYADMIIVSISVFIFLFICIFCSIMSTGEIETSIKLGQQLSLNIPMIIVGIITLLISILGINTMIRIVTLIIKGRKIIYNSDQTKIDVFAILTGKGIIEKEKWLALKKFLKQNTLIKDYNVDSIVINEEYLVYATLFGIAHETLEDLGKNEPIILPWE